MERTMLRELLDGLARDRRAGRGFGGRLCAACVDILAVTAAGIAITDTGSHRSAFGSSDRSSRDFEELQFTLGEGPGVDAYSTGRPVLEPDLRNPVTPRWPTFSPSALDAGVEAVFGFPLQVGAIRLGTLDLYRDRSGDLAPEQLADALIMADVVTHAVLELQAVVPPGGLASELDHPGRLRLVVHQACGMVSVQLDIPVDDALVRLRASAYVETRPIDEVARDVVARRLRLDR